jgi:beta-galactosidase
VGTESGYGRETEWSVVPLTLREGAAPRPGAPHPLDDAFVPGDLTAADLGSRDAIRGASVLAWYPAETDVSIRPGWFYHAKQDTQVKTPEKLVDIYFSSAGRNGLLLLNVPPDTRGRVADADVKSLMGMRAILDRTFSSPASEARPPRRAPGGGLPAVYEVPVSAGGSFDVALLQEDIRQGQRVEQFTLEVCAAGACREFARGTTIGYKRLLRFPEVRIDPAQRDARVRLTIGQTRGTPAVSAMAVYRMGTGQPQAAPHSFTLGKTDFLLDGAPFQIIGCEMHPARIPAEYWAHRIRMAKAMGCNTIGAYLFWNYHETAEGVFDFTTGNRDVARFVRLAQDEGMWVLLRPGPYVCAEWDFGGIPVYLLRYPDLKVRCMNPQYMQAAERYIQRLAAVVKPLMVARGGPIVMVQIENEYGSYGNDRVYMERLREAWVKAGVDGPFYTADGPTPYMLEAGHLAGAAVGLDSGSEERHWELARSVVPGVPVFSSETYPGWLTHWGEAWARPKLDDLIKEVSFLLAGRKSFNFYVAHGGTNFGFTAGANSGGKGYEPDVTSYDYDAPINEQGRPTEKYHALRKLVASYLPAGQSLAPIPDPIPAIGVPEFAMRAHASLWNHLPAPVTSVQPKPFEAYGQDQGLVLYRTTLVGRKSGRLIITDLHDYANVFVDGKLVGTLDRRLGEKSIELPRTDNPMPVLDILVEGMGHINFAQEMIDRKGITDRVTLQGMTLMNWEVFLLPLGDAWVGALPAGAIDARPGTFFRGSFTLDTPADTFIDMTGYRKGVVWVNGHNLGRYWDIGPQKRLYCPAPWLKTGVNEVVVFDLHQTTAAPLRGAPGLE